MVSLHSQPWPAVECETREWIPSTGFGIRAAREGLRPERYDAAVVPQIAALSPVLPGDVAAEAEEAAQELSRFDAALGARVAGFAPVLLRSEASSSSQIENLTASARAIFSAELGAKTGRNAELIAANTRALQAALELAGEISPATIADMHRVLMDGQARHTPGQYRTEPVWIGTRSDSPVGATFVPPSHDRLAGLIEDLTRFSTRWDVPSLTAVAIAHAQFEAIHPFTDGNGWTGRALAQSMLRFRGVTRNVAVPVSAGLLAARPVLDAARAAQALGIAQPNVYPPLRALVDAGIVKSKAEHRLGPFWRSDEILDAVDAFIRRAGRPSRG